MWGGLPRKVCTSAHVSGPKLLTFQVIYHTGERMEIRLTSFLLKDAVDYRLVDAVFDERRAARHAPQPPGVGFVLSKEQLGHSLAGQPVVAKFVMPGMHEMNARCFTLDCCQRRPTVVVAPGPRVAEPERGEQ